MVPSIDAWTPLQFASFYHIFSQSAESMKRRSTLQYTDILINNTSFKKNQSPPTKITLTF